MNRGICRNMRKKEEVFFDGSSLYIGFQLVTQDEEGFGHEILKTREDGSQLDYSMIQMDGTWSDGSEEHVFSELLIGEQTAHDTFEGRIKIATENIDKNVEEIQMHIILLFWTDYDKLEGKKTGNSRGGSQVSYRENRGLEPADTGKSG